MAKVRGVATVRTPLPLGDDPRMQPFHQSELPSWQPFPLGQPARSSLSDEDLLELVATRQDEPAFDELYRRYARAVYGVGRRLIRDHARSEDAAQQAFINAWRFAAGYRRERGPATGWLFAIARNAALDTLRSQASTNHSEPPDIPDREPEPDERVLAAEDAFRVHAAVDGLSETEREVIELAYYHGLSQSEIATRLGTPLGTVKTRTRRALAHLATCLADERVMG
ncbi:MAG TPA: sigma-70 family RNA polymerase sigma factor [Gaiellales bacterium]|nr:sigma-70 family RNA polymerase sigma factor [Gaiellales bacterium]